MIINEKMLIHLACVFIEQEWSWVSWGTWRNSLEGDTSQSVSGVTQFTPPGACSSPSTCPAVDRRCGSTLWRSPGWSVKSEAAPDRADHDEPLTGGGVTIKQRTVPCFRWNVLRGLHVSLEKCVIASCVLANDPNYPAGPWWGHMIRLCHDWLKWRLVFFLRLFCLILLLKNIV